MSELESEQERLERKLERKQDELKSFEDEPATQVERRLTELSDGIEATTDRTPTDPDNRSMYEHLLKLKTGIENDREAFVRWRINNIEGEISETEKELEELD